MGRWERQWEGWMLGLNASLPVVCDETHHHYHSTSGSAQDIDLGLCVFAYIKLARFLFQTPQQRFTGCYISTVSSLEFPVCEGPGVLNVLHHGC